MSDSINFQDRLFLEGQAVYQRIADGQVTDVEAELMEAHLRASEEGDES
ncbi:hypothetical protein [Streptomyces sp. MUSC 14]|nr:hypothetical protein [Streptomyces sp. MUSC 14]